MSQTIEKIILKLDEGLDEDYVVVNGWPEETELFDSPVISVTAWEHWPTNADVNIWANTLLLRDIAAEKVLTILQAVGETQVVIQSIGNIDFEEKGQISPKSYRVVSGTRPIYRKLIQISLS